VTTFIPDLPVSSISRHPKNPRHSAVADPELIDSVRVNGLVQPLIVAPVPDAEGKYVLIAGHRRHDALKKAKRKAAPAVVRDDLVTEGQQVEAMLIENGRRKDLTPIEEAEGYQQLVLFGYKQKDIAKAVGRDPKTISTRLKLLKLASSTRAKVHKGQMSIDDAAAIAEFADDPQTTKRLESASSFNFKYELERARRDRKAAREVASAVADLAARGVPETPRPDGFVGGSWNAWEKVAGARSLSGTPLREPADHDGCLTWMQFSPTELLYGCTHPTGHDDARTDEERERLAANERDAAEREKAERAADAARAVRIQTVTEAAGLAPLTAPLPLVIRSLLPALIYDLNSHALEAYQDAVGIIDEQRWSTLTYYNVKDTEQRKFWDHVDDLDRLADNTVTKALVAVLAAASDDRFEQAGHWSGVPALARRHHDLLEALGHDDCDVDVELLAAAQPAEQEAKAS
jgi:ParB/RepB/Spo0J family partition protein